MSELYRSSPLDELQRIREIHNSDDDRGIPFLRELSSAENFLRELIRDNEELEKFGAVVSVEGSWGSGKTTFTKMLLKSIEDLNVAVVEYDCLFYGNASEAADIFIRDIFSVVKEHFGINLDTGGNLIKNISPRFELSNGMPKLSFEFSSRKPTEKVIKKELAEKLNSLGGKVLIVIDDLDRVTSADILHFLRIVRVLRELPNFIIILPVDMDALQLLLKKENITKPKPYLQKIVDKSYYLNTDEHSAGVLFTRLLIDKYNQLLDNQETVNTLWQLYLWEISLITIKPRERNGMTFSMNAQPTASTWAQLSPIESQGNNNIVREFFARTSKTYGADSNFVFRMEGGDPGRDKYIHYSELYPNNTFTELMRGMVYSDQPVSAMSKGGMLTARWWPDRTAIRPMRSANADSTPATAYSLRVPLDGETRSVHYENLNSQSQSIWSVVRDIPQGRVPKSAMLYLTPRIINRVVNHLDIDDYLATSDDYEGILPQLGELIGKAVREAVIQDD